MFGRRYSFGSRHLRNPYIGWGYQDFAAGVITGTAVTLTDNENGDNVIFIAAKVVDGSATILRTPTTDYTETTKRVYSGATAILSTTVKVNAQTDDSVTLNAIPHASWPCRIYFLYEYTRGIPKSYRVPPKSVTSLLFSEIETMLITEQELTGGTKSPTFAEVTVDNLNLNANTLQATTGRLSLTGAGDVIITATADDIELIAADKIWLKPSGNEEDYVEFATVSDIPTISTVGGNQIIIDDLLSVQGPYVANKGNLQIKADADQHSYLAIDAPSATKNEGILFCENETIKWYLDRLQSTDELRITTPTTQLALFKNDGSTLFNSTLTLASGSITDTTGTIDFDNENLTTTSTITGGTLTDGTFSVAGGDISGILTFDGGGLQDFTLTEVGSVTDSIKLDKVNRLYVSGGYIYAVAYEATNQYFTILDATTDADGTRNPVILGSLTTGIGNVDGIWVAGKYAYLAETATPGKLQVIDISNPSAPSIVGSVNTGGNNAVECMVVGKYAYVVELVGDALSVIDISDPTTPVEVGNTGTQAELNGAHGVYVVGDYAYVAAANYDGLTAVDVSDPTNPTVAGTVTNGTSLNGAGDVEVRGRFAYVTAEAGDYLTIVDIKDPTANPMSIIGSVTDGTNLNGIDGIHLIGNYAICCSTQGDKLTLVDVSDPANPAVVGTPISVDGDDVYVNGRYAYVANEAADTIKVYRIVGLETPTASIGDLKADCAHIWQRLDVGHQLNVHGGANIGYNLFVDDDFFANGTIEGTTLTDGTFSATGGVVTGMTLGADLAGGNYDITGITELTLGYDGSSNDPFIKMWAENTHNAKIYLQEASNAGFIIDFNATDNKLYFQTNDSTNGIDPAITILRTNGMVTINEGLTTATGANIAVGASTTVAFGVGADMTFNAVGALDGTQIGTAANQEFAFWGATPRTQLLKADFNNWAALSDVVDALVAIGLFDQA